MLRRPARLTQRWTRVSIGRAPCSTMMFNNAAPLLKQATRAFGSQSAFGQGNFSSGNALPLPREDQKLFVQYQEIELPTETRIKTMRDFFGPKEECWVALEKVHGANFGIYLLQDGSMKFAKRSGIMDHNEHFFGYHSLVPQFRAQINKAKEVLMKELAVPDIGKIILHGELFGLKYQHPDVPLTNKWCELPNKRKFPMNRIQIQEEPFPQYSPELHFFCFDIKYSLSGSDADLKLLNYDQFALVCKQIPDFLYARALVRGTLDRCIAFDIENFQTPLPAQLGMGNYPLKNNWAEGVIVRHVDHDTDAMKTRLTTGQGVCTCLKLRCSAFMELKHPEKQLELKRTFIDTVRAAAVAAVGETTAIQSNLLPQMEATANELLINYVSEGRLSNVISKYGREALRSGTVTKDQLILYLAKDALKDFLKELEDDRVLNMGYSFRQQLATNCYWEADKLVKNLWDGLVKEV